MMGVFLRPSEQGVGRAWFLSDYELSQQRCPLFLSIVASCRTTKTCRVQVTGLRADSGRDLLRRNPFTHAGAAPISVQRPAPRLPWIIQHDKAPRPPDGNAAPGGAWPGAAWPGGGAPCAGPAGPLSPSGLRRLICTEAGLCRVNASNLPATASGAKSSCREALAWPPSYTHWSGRPSGAEQRPSGGGPRSGPLPSPAAGAAASAERGGPGRVGQRQRQTHSDVFLSL